MVPFERALVSSYRPSIVTLPLYLRDTCFRSIIIEKEFVEDGEALPSLENVLPRDRYEEIQYVTSSQCRRRGTPTSEPTKIYLQQPKPAFQFIRPQEYCL